MSKRSISITTSSANRSHNHLPPPAVVASGAQRIPGILSIPGLDLRQPPAGRRGHRQSASHSSKKKHFQSPDSLPTSNSMPAALNSQIDSPKPDFPTLMSHPSGRLARARAQSRSLSGIFPTSNSLPIDESLSDPFISSPISTLSTQRTLPSSEPKSTLEANSRRSRTPRHRSHKPKSKTGGEKYQRTMYHKTETKHLQSEMKERMAEVPSDSAPEDIAMDFEDVALPTESSSAPASVAPTTPPPFISNTPFTFPPITSTSTPIPVPRSSVPTESVPPSAQPQSQPRRTYVHNSAPFTPPRSTSFQPSSMSRASTASHTRNHSHPFQFSASAPSSPSHPLLFGARYANSTFQHSPSPNVLPKPKFLDSMFMEVDEAS